MRQAMGSVGVDVFAVAHAGDMWAGGGVVGAIAGAGMPGTRGDYARGESAFVYSTRAGAGSCPGLGGVDASAVALEEGVR